MIYNFFRQLILKVAYILPNKKIRTFTRNRLHQNLNSLSKDITIWIHCSSVGEVNLTNLFIRKLIDKKNTKILISVFTDTGLKRAQTEYKDNENVIIIYFPLDDKRKISEILSKIDIKKLILVETELWPNLISLAHETSRVILINGRISEKNYPKYKKIKFFLKNILSKIDFFYMQTETDANRITSLGAPKNKIAIVGNLKFHVNCDKVTKNDIDAYKSLLNIKNKKILVAGSIRSGETEILLSIFKKLKDYILILVPRHLEKIESIENLISETSFSYVKYSELESMKEKFSPKDNNIPNDIDIIIVDKFGILKKLYAISTISFVGGTLVDIGGHSLLEPLFYGKPPIYGYYTQNVKDISKEILKHELGYQVESEDDFLQAVQTIESICENENDSNNLNSKIKKFFKYNKKTYLKILESEEKWEKI